MTFRSILVPLDRSAFGEQALPHALGLARRAGARLELLHVHVPQSYFDLPDSHPPVAGDEHRQALGQGRTYLDGVARRARVAAPVETTCTVVEGLVPDAVCEAVARSNPDLVVLATHGRGPLSRLWLGGVAAGLIQSSPAPLMLVRPTGVVPDLAADPAPRRVLIPFDGSSFGEHIIPTAVAVGSVTGAEYRLLRVVPPVLTSGWLGAGIRAREAPPVVDQLRVEAERYLAGLGGRFPGLAPARPHVVADWPPAAAILSDAATNGIDLIAMTTRGRCGLTKLLLGSVVDQVLDGATIPVLLRREPEG